MTSNVEVQKIRVQGHRHNWVKSCKRCMKKLDNGHYYRWRLQPDDSNKYLRGMFWTIHCEDCLVKTKDQWIEALENLQV